MVDTNVFAVAERLHDSATDECVAACNHVLGRVAEGQRIGVDSSDEILAEYLGVLRNAPTAGLAKKLAQRLWRVRHDGRICHQIDIAPIDVPPGSYAEVPAALRDFDTDDQKFFAVAAVEGGTPPIFQALDSEWWGRRADIVAAGFDVQFLCVADNLNP